MKGGCATGDSGRVAESASGRPALRLAMILLVCAAAASAGQPEAGVARPVVAPAAPCGGPALSEVVWSELRFKAQKYLLSASASLSVEVVATEEVLPALRAVEDDFVIAPRSPRVAVVTLESRMPFGRREVASSWIEAANGVALQSEKTNHGKRYWKLRRYLGNGYVMWRAAAADSSEKDVGPDGWTRRRRSVVSWEAPAGSVVTDSYALLYLIAASRLDREGSEMAVCVPADDGVVELRFAAGERLSLAADFSEEWPGGSRSRLGATAVRSVTGTAHALTGEGSGTDQDVDTGLFGMRGGLRLFVQLGTGIPVEVRGRTKDVGKLKVRLKKVTLKGAPGSPEQPAE